MSANPNRPIIIKRKKVIKGGGHHGGAWKVAMFSILFGPHFANRVWEVPRPSRQ